MLQCDRGYSMIEPGPSGATCIAGEWSPPQLPRSVCTLELETKVREDYTKISPSQ